MNFKITRRAYCLSTLLIILWCALAMFGCDRGSTSAGKYLAEKNPQYITELKSDGTFLINQGNINANGKYLIEGKRLKLTLSSGEVVVGSIDGRTITDNEGIRWTKQ